MATKTQKVLSVEGHERRQENLVIANRAQLQAHTWNRSVNSRKVRKAICIMKNCSLLNYYKVCLSNDCLSKERGSQWATQVTVILKEYLYAMGKEELPFQTEE